MVKFGSAVSLETSVVSKQKVKNPGHCYLY